MGLEVTGTREALEALRERSARMRQLGPMIAVLTEELQAMALQSFETERGPSGRAWRPRAAEVRASDGRTGRARSVRRQARAMGDSLLRRSGELIGSIIARPEDNAIVVEAGSGHAEYHQFGTEHVPARPFLPVTRRGPLRTGPGGVWWRLLPRRVAEFITSGRT